MWQKLEHIKQKIENMLRQKLEQKKCNCKVSTFSWIDSKKYIWCTKCGGLINKPQESELC